MNQTIVWGIVVLLVVLFVCLMFKKEIGQAITERGISTPWASTGAPSKVQTQQNASNIGIDEVDINSDIVMEYESRITAANKSKDDLQEELARTQVALSFERILRIIFGSQIGALKKINEMPQGSSQTDLQNEYKKHLDYFRSVDAEPISSFAQWMNYLVIINFVEARGDVYCILPAGNMFLRYIIEMHYSENRIA